MRFWLSEWSWYGGQSYGNCAFSTKEEAIKYAIFQAKGSVDWANFPDPKKEYPYDDRDGSNVPVLTPVFRVTWDTEGGGSAQVTEMTVSEEFNWGADYGMKQVESILAALKAKKDLVIKSTTGETK